MDERVSASNPSACTYVYRKNWILIRFELIHCASSKAFYLRLRTIAVASCPVGTWDPFPGAKARPGYDPDHSPPSSAEFMNE
jgi:hypothetical protein